MIRASLYIVACTARNRLRVRLRRLREPRYLVGALAAVLYFYFTFFVRVRSGRAAAARRRRGAPGSFDAVVALQAAGPRVAALGLLVLAALVWVFPGQSTLLQFSPAETDLLVPAPITRRQLLLHRVIRSQIGLLFASILPAVLLPSSSALSRVRFAIAVWLVLVTAKIYFTGVTLTRTRLRSGRADRRGAWAPVLVLLIVIGIVVASVWRSFNADMVHGPQDLFQRLSAVAASGTAGLVMVPLVALAGPLFAPWPWPFVRALVPAALVLAAAIVWVLESDAVVEKTTAAAATGGAGEHVTAAPPGSRARVVGWQLAPRGRAEGVFLWKNMVQMLRATTGGTLVRYLAPAIVITVAVATMVMSGNRARGTAMSLCSLALGLGVFTVMLGPQVVRTDLRDDLRHLELLKTWPIPSPAVIRGEMLGPGVLLTAIAWLAIVSAAILSAAAFPELPFPWRFSGSMAALLLAPALVFAQLTVHNATAVLFPAWVPLGSSRPRGLDAMGQRLILFGAVVATLIFMMIPGAIVSGILWLVFQRFLGAAVLIPCAIVCLCFVVIEVIAATEVLGPAYERMDLLAAERAE